MTNSLLKIETILPPLLEQQLSVPYRIVSRHLNYLQKCRECLLEIWTNSSVKEADRRNIQQSVDEFISMILLIDFVGRLCPTAIPSLDEILRSINEPTAFNLCEAVCNRVSCKLLKTIFDSASLSSLKIEPKKDFEVSSLANISKSVEILYGSRMPITLFGDFHQLCLNHPIADAKTSKISNRHNKGVYYTPAPLVDYIIFNILKKVFCKSDRQQLKNLRIFDPSCGCGAFLIAGIRFILNWLRDKNSRSSNLSLQQCMELLELMIYGVDIDERAINWTRRLLLLTIWDFYIKDDVSKADVKNLRIPTFENNIVCKDFLEEQSFKDEAFNIIVGGPPFVRIQELYKSNPAKIGNYRHNFRTAKNGQFDLYMLFVEKAIELLRDDGYLGMSLSNTFLRSESGCVLRKLIAEKCSTHEIVEFEDHKLYPNALVQIVVITLQKTIEKNTARHIFVKGRGSLRWKLNKIDKQNNNSFLQIRNLPVTACASENWILRSENDTDFLQKVESAGISLEKLSTLICFGTATGADNVFLLKNVGLGDSKTVWAKSRYLNEDIELEFSILRPVLRGRYIKEYAIPKSKTFCIFPYDDTGQIISDKIFSKEFPHTYKYLKSCQSYLNSRKLKQERPWYAFRKQDISYFIQNPKVVASVVNTGGGFTIDRHQLFCNNSVIIVCPNKELINYYFLLAVLNSRVFKIWTQYRMPTLGSNWYSYRVGIMRKFPVLVPQNKQLINEIADIVAQVLNEGINETERTKLLSLIDNMIFELYGITPV